MRHPTILVSSLFVAVGCGARDPVSLADLRIDRVEVLSGEGQTGVEGQPLSEPIVARAVLDNGALYLGTVHVRVESGNGSIRTDAGGSAVGNGGSLAQARTVAVTWTLGPASEAQVLRVFVVAGDTVSTTVSATVVAAGG